MFFESLIEIGSVLRRNKLRTFLTALSVAWGMFMLSLLLGAGRGLENGVAWEFRDEAVNSIWVNGQQTSVAYAGRGPGRDVRLTNDDYAALARSIPQIEQLTGRFFLYGEFFVRYRDRHAAFDIRGAHPAHRYVEKTQMVRGRYLNAKDVEERRKVAVIGSKVREALFGERSAIGEYIEIRGLHYRVVGEFQDEGGEAELRKIYVPISTAQLVYNAPGRIHHLIFTLKSDDIEQSRQAAALTRSLLGKRHSIAPDDRRALRVNNNLDRFLKLTGAFAWITVFVWIVGAGTLLAGIIGVGNIMLISVAERTKEIGIRKALGATPASIVRMIVIEAMLITALSGYAGLVAGVLLVEAVADATRGTPFLRDPSVDLRVALTASALLVVAGMLAGLFPALRAARVDPIVALRQGD
ncbi:MAG TPA: ABC transporter permease [Polyangiaceae bacterium]|nr:ABC transporter permease [Polyangiaceae bacterium]